MMGRDHALSGALVFAGLAPVLHVTDAHLAAGIALCAGAGVLPDIDHRDTSVSGSFGFLTEGFSWLVAKLSGGHRHGTHSLFGIAAFTAGALAAGAYQLSGPRLSGFGHPGFNWHSIFSWHILPALLFLSLLYSAALRAVHVGGHHGDLLGIAAAVVTCYTGADLTRLTVGSWRIPMLAVVIALGCAAHIAGDELTHGGCPIFWPVSMHEFHLLPRPLQITTAKLCETWVIFPLLVAGLGLAVWNDTGHSLPWSPARAHPATATHAVRTPAATRAHMTSATRARASSKHPSPKPRARVASRHSLPARPVTGPAGHSPCQAGLAAYTSR
jgi:membrane-bound metal-dependent hydrolase YbcI (DUF457 family)